MDRLIAYSIACTFSFLEFGFGVFIAVVPWGDIVAGFTLAFFGLTVFGLSVYCALREMTPRVSRAGLDELYAPEPATVRVAEAAHFRRTRRAA
jgi:hypothetical protein